MGKDPLAVHCSELMRLDRMPSASEVRSGKVHLCCLNASLLLIKKL